MTMKSRLRRLLGGKSRFLRKNSHQKLVIQAEAEAEEEDTVLLSENSSYASQDAADDDHHHHHHPHTHSTTSFHYGPNGCDPYADVRDVLEELSARDRARYADHTEQPYEELCIPTMVAYFVYLSYAVLIFMGHLRDFCAQITGKGRYVRSQQHRNNNPSDDLQYYAPLLKSWENFYTRRLYNNIQDVFNRPIASNPGATISVLERVSNDGRKSMHVLGNVGQTTDDNNNDNNNTNSQLQQQQKLLLQQYQTKPHYTRTYDGSIARRCINLGSYNYLGFADDWGSTCATPVKHSLVDLPISASSSRLEYGTTSVHRQLERTVADFLGKEDAMVLTMGFNTNATTIPALVGPGDLVISDELNHTSIVNGARSSGAAIRIFRHNDMTQLETLLRETIVMGRPRTRRPWNKIMVVVEGIYSMEGEYCDLKRVVTICKRYGAYVYLDEAHSIGAMGPTGRGCAEYTGVDTADIDIMMGTFTKSFGGMGGYIAADKNTIAMLRQSCAGSVNHNSLSPTVCQQVITSFQIIMGEDGTNIGRNKLQALRDNSNYFRMRLRQMGLQVLGQYDSPIMPVMLYHPGKISGFSRECFKRGLAVVVVGFPAVPLLMSRARFCMSAAHTRADLDRALQELQQVADLLKIKYCPENPEIQLVLQQQQQQQRKTSC